MIGDQNPDVNEQGKDGQHDGEEEGGEASLDAGEEGEAGGEEGYAGQVAPEHLRRRQTFGNQWGGEVHVEEVGSAEDERGKAEGQLADEGKACGQRAVDASCCGVDDEGARSDGELLGEAFVGAVFPEVSQQHGAVHDDDDEEDVVRGEGGGAEGRRAAPLQDDPGAEQEGSGGVGQGDAVGKVIGYGLTGDEVAPYHAGQADGHDAETEDMAAESCANRERLRVAVVG